MFRSYPPVKISRMRKLLIPTNDAIFADYASGMSMQDVGDKHGMSRDTVRNRLIAAGVRPRHRAAHMSGPSNPTRGKGHTPEATAKMRAANLRQFSSAEARERHAILTCRQIAEGRTGKAFNRLEKKVAAILTSEGLEFTQQFRLGRFVYDFHVPATNTLVEAHGTFWHADPRFYDHSSLSPIQARNVANDARKATQAKREGFALRIIWESDV